MNIEATKMSSIIGVFRGLSHKLYSIRNRTQITYIDESYKDTKTKESKELDFKGPSKKMANAWMLNVVPEDDLVNINLEVSKGGIQDHKKVINRTLSAPTMHKVAKSPIVRRKSESDIYIAPRSDNAAKALEAYGKAIANLDHSQNKYEVMASMHMEAIKNPNISLDVRINHYINAESDLNIAIESGSVSAAHTLSKLQNEMKHIMHLSNANNPNLSKEERIAEFNKTISHLQNAIFEGDDNSAEMLRSILFAGLRISASSSEYLVHPDKEAAYFIRQMQDQSIRMRNMGFDKMLEYDASHSHLSSGEMRFHRAAFMKEISIHFKSIYPTHSDIENKAYIAKNLFMNAIANKGIEENYSLYKDHILKIG